MPSSSIKEIIVKFSLDLITKILWDYFELSRSFTTPSLSSKVNSNPMRKNAAPIKEVLHVFMVSFQSTFNTILS